MDLYYRIFEQAPDALIIVDSAGRILKANASVEALFGYTPDELAGREIEVLIPRRFVARHAGYRNDYLNAPHTRRMGTSKIGLFALRKNGTEVPVDILIAPLDADPRQLVLCAVRDVSVQRAAEEQLRHHAAELESLHEQLTLLASRDALTGLLNRRTFQENTEWLLRNAARRQESLSLLMIDLDFFKRINDQFGHAEGDRALRAVAAALQAVCRQNDLLARYGGEEFAVALPDTDEAGSRVVAENFRAAVQAIEGLSARVTASIGIATHIPLAGEPAGAVQSNDLIERADQALYCAKNSGRNRTCHVASMLHPPFPAPDRAA